MTTASGLQGKNDRSEAIKAKDSTAKHFIRKHYQPCKKLDSTDSRRRFSRRGSKTAAMLIRDACGYEEKVKEWLFGDSSITQRCHAGKGDGLPSPPPCHQAKSESAQTMSTTTTDYHGSFREELAMPAIIPLSSHRLSSLDTTSLGDSLQRIELSLAASEGSSHHHDKHPAAHLMVPLPMGCCTQFVPKGLDHICSHQQTKQCDTARSLTDLNEG